MRGSLAPESIIDKLLRSLGCGGRHFVDIARTFGISVSQGGFSEIMNEKKDFQRDVAERLLNLLDEMERLKRAVESVTLEAHKGIVVVRVDWSDTKKISDVLTLRRLASVGAEIGDSSFDKFAADATKSVGK